MTRKTNKWTIKERNKQKADSKKAIASIVEDLNKARKERKKKNLPTKNFPSYLSHKSLALFFPVVGLFIRFPQSLHLL